MHVETLESEAALGFLMFDFYNQLINDIVQAVAKNNKSLKKILVIKETWYFQENLNEDIKNNLDSDLVLTFAMMDNNHLDYSEIERAGIPMYHIGYYKESPYWCDVISLLVNKHFEIHPDFLKHGELIDTAFMSLNGKPYWHRKELVDKLKKFQLIEKGFVSYNPFEDTPDSIKLDDIHDNKAFPPPHGAMSLGNIHNWNRHFLNLTTETDFNPDDKWFWTEKTWKPILGLRPFLTYAPQNNIPMLSRHKFQHFANDFTDITDLDLTDHTNHYKFLKVLCKQDEKYFKHKYKKLYNKIALNRANFDLYIVKQQKTIANAKRITI